MLRSIKTLAILFVLTTVALSISFAQLKLSPVWVKKAGVVSWLQTDNAARGIAYNPVNDHVYVVQGLMD